MLTPPINANPVAEVQAYGWRADETDSGLLKVQPVVGEAMVFVPFHGNAFGGQSPTPSGFSQKYNAQGAPGTWVSAVYTIQPRTGDPTFASYNAHITFMARGRRFAIVCEPYQSGGTIVNNTYPIQGWVDGQAFEIKNYQEDVASGTAGSAIAGAMIANTFELPVYLDDDLPHQIEIYMPCDPTLTCVYQFYGFCVEARTGQQPYPQEGFCNVNTPAANTFTSVLNGLTTFAYIEKLIFVSTGVDALSMDLDGVTVYNALAMAANVPVVWDFGFPVPYTTSVASASSQRARFKSLNGLITCYAVVRSR